MPVNPTKSHLDYYYNIICYHKPSFLQFIAVALTFNVPAGVTIIFGQIQLLLSYEEAKKH